MQSNDSATRANPASAWVADWGNALSVLLGAYALIYLGLMSVARDSTWAHVLRAVAFIPMNAGAAVLALRASRRPDTDVRIPPYTKQLDYELEWGVYIGKQGTDIPVDRAHEYIGGYTIFNDFSARDTQQHEMRGRLGPAKGKDFDTGNAIGPWLVTPDEIPDPYNLTMTARVDGEEWSRGNSGETSYRFDELIAYMSRSETLYPGDFIGSGTCSGRLGKGCGLEQGRFLTAGNIVELEVEHIGVLRNRVISSTSRGRPGPKL